ncbi:MAG TPA: hypothetical protein VL325_00590, partial [Pyrinomonadaceae bacterium]|nr:hypothetical protein [Pyrinomonadaceae bacterium]
DSSPENPQPESLFSIQFFPNYVAAFPARILGLSASQMMPIVSIFSAFFTTLAVFWLILSFTDDDLLAFAVTLVVMAGGAMITGIGAINGFFEGGVAYPFFPFLRRPIPSVAFPFLFAFFACLWNGLKADKIGLKYTYSALTAVCFAALVFSYFYLWTSAVAVFAGLIVFTLLGRGENFRSDLKFLAVTGALFLAALIPYALLLVGRNKMADKAQLLVFTRDLDLNRNVEIIGLAVLITTGVSVALRLLELTSRKAQFIAALALSPIIVFNQQVLSGRSLQPFHYEFYVINYVVLLAVCLLVLSLWQSFVTVRWATVAFAIVFAAGATVWGYVEATQTTVFWDDTNVQRDEAMPVNLRLRELAGPNPAQARLQTTINLESLQADSQPTVAPQAVLWARHQHTFAGLESWEENKLRYYQLLYFSGTDGHWLRRALTGCADIEACMALFGWDRFNARLSANARPLTQEEVDAEAANYQQFVHDFNRDSLDGVDIRYLIVDNELVNNLENIDRWFIRDDGEVLGNYTLFRLTPRN